MIERVELHSFKCFKDQIFELSDNVVLAGPNNTGKTTFLQAIAVWNLALQKWLFERGPESGSKARKRTGVPITRKDFTAVPLREMNLLWHNCSTALLKNELKNGQNLGTPRLLEIGLHGTKTQSSWELIFEFRYQNSELLYARPAESTPIERIQQSIENLHIVHVPPFSGIGAEETHYDKPYQDLLVGQGKPGDILRNLLLEIYNNDAEKWKDLCRQIEEIFAYELLPPVYEGRPYILCEYRPGSPGGQGYPKLDISCAGSGFHQVLTLLGFFYARPASILLLDEPDAHLHIILQKQVHNRLREIAREQGCQLLIATHSEVFVDASSPDRIISFLGKPHSLVKDSEREEVREALKRLTSLDVLMAEQAPGILYVESETDLDMLREWAFVLKHPVYDFLAHPFWHSNLGCHPREARAHFFALKAVKPGICGLLLLDGDNRNLPEHELSAEGLMICRWQRYEIENYLIHPEVLTRFIEGSSTELFTQKDSEDGVKFLKGELPPVVFNDPLGEHDYLKVTPASKSLLPNFFNAARIDITQKEYYHIARQMLKEEIPPEVNEKLDLIRKHFKL